MTDVKHTPGRVVWRELMTDDVAKAKTFYSELFGWTFQDFDMGPNQPPYPILSMNGKAMGGIMLKPKDAAFPSFWGSYVSVPDVDAAVARAKERGGSATFGPIDVPQVGRLGMIADFDGAVIGLLHSTMSDPEPAMPKVGEFCWESITSSDPARATEFYKSVFGWQVQQMPGGGGTVLAVGSAPSDGVADLGKAEGMPAAWVTYVVVETIEAGRAKAEKLGAKVIVPLIEVPKIGRISFIADPTGAVLGLFQPQMG